MSCQEDVDSNEWLGKFSVNQTCDGATNPDYVMQIRAVAHDSSALVLNNLGGYGEKVAATVAGDSLIITPTDVNVGLMGKVRLSGSGQWQAEELQIDLTVRVPGPQGTITTSTCQLKGIRL